MRGLGPRRGSYVVRGDPTSVRVRRQHGSPPAVGRDAVRGVACCSLLERDHVLGPLAGLL